MFKRGKNNLHLMLRLSVNLNLLFYFTVTYVVGTHWNCLIEAIPMCTYNICLSNN